MTKLSFGTRSPRQLARRSVADRLRPLEAVDRRSTAQVTFCVRGVISPLLANIYLHYTLDLWATRWRRREATGDMIFVRYADDFIVGFQYESDARRFLDELHKRLREYALSLHPEKTRLIEFGRFAAERRQRRGL